MSKSATYTAFAGWRRLFSGKLADVALSAQAAADRAAPVVAFEDGGGLVVDLDLSGSEHDVRARYSATRTSDQARAPGRPKLGVVAREVTLLPRQWDWLATQPGGASAALRRLVEAARKQSETAERLRDARERAHCFLRAIGGDRPGFDEVARALFAGDKPDFVRRLAEWAPEVAAHALWFAASAFEDQGETPKTSL